MADNRQLEDWHRQALLTEYQVCQQENSSNQLRFWTVAGIFIGVSSALFAGFLFGVLANDRLFRLFVKMITEAGSGTKIWILRIIILVLSLVILSIFWFLRLWMRRVGFLCRINYERMRDIESRLGMWQNWRIYGVDQYKDGKFDSSIKSFEEMLLKYRKPDWWKKWRTIPRYRYGKPNRRNYDAIFGALIFLWLFVVFSLWISLLPIPLAFSLILAFVLAIVIDFLIICLTRPA